MLRLCVALFSSVLALSSLAAPQVFVVGLFPGAAVLNVDGQRKLVRVGQTGPQGVQVVSADSRKAVLRIDGVERTYELSREYNEAGYSAPQRQSFSIARGTGGHYWVAGSVNGQNMQFLVDTGATSIAMNENEARRLGIDYRVDGKPMVASTASGTSRGWRVTLDRVKRRYRVAGCRGGGDRGWLSDRSPARHEFPQPGALARGTGNAAYRGQALNVARS